MKHELRRSVAILFTFLLLNSTNLRVNSGHQLFSIHHKYTNPFAERADLKYRPSISPGDRQLKQVTRARHKKSKEHSPTTINVEFRPAKSYKKRAEVNDLLEDKFTPRTGGHLTNKRLKKLAKKENVLMLADEIADEADKYDLRIDRVILGPKVKKTMRDKKLAMDLSKALNRGSIKPLMARLKQKFKSIKQSIEHRKSKRAKSKHKRQRKKRKLRRRAKHKLKRRRRHKLKQKAKHRKLEKKKDLRKLMSSSSSSSSSKSKSGGGSDQSLEKFQFLPGYAGMPFPPFMMNGPHFHPPLNVTVNAIPNRDSKRELNPHEIEEENLKNQQEAMKPIKDQMRAIMEQIQNVSSDINVNLSDEFEKVQNLYA